MVWYFTFLFSFNYSQKKEKENEYGRNYNVDGVRCWVCWYEDAPLICLVLVTIYSYGVLYNARARACIM